MRYLVNDNFCLICYGENTFRTISTIVSRSLALMAVPVEMKSVLIAVIVYQDGPEPIVNQTLELVKIDLARMMLLVLISSRIISVCKWKNLLVLFYPSSTALNTCSISSTNWF